MANLSLHRFQWTCKKVLSLFARGFSFYRALLGFALFALSVLSHSWLTLRSSFLFFLSSHLFLFSIFFYLPPSLSVSFYFFLSFSISIVSIFSLRLNLRFQSNFTTTEMAVNEHLPPHAHQEHIFHLKIFSSERHKI